MVAAGSAYATVYCSGFWSPCATLVTSSVWSLTFMTTDWTRPLTTSLVKLGVSLSGGVTVPSDTVTRGHSSLMLSCSIVGTSLTKYCSPSTCVTLAVRSVVSMTTDFTASAWRESCSTVNWVTNGAE